jgi:glucosamine 6-phosphate synthetase-like amidotransferase/phosphosugar isomerase protein
MCAIFGANLFETYKKLYNSCKARGEFAYGSLYVGNPAKCSNLVVTKSAGSVQLSKNEKFSDEDRELVIDDFKLFLGHTQAPTSSVREFSAATSHPFTCGEWVVAHNGVLTNFQALKKLIVDPTSYNDVDTSIIPAYIDQIHSEVHDEITAISEALSKLKGTFGLWIFNKRTGHVYLARCGSTLYSDFLTNDFSSLLEKHYQPLEEGTIYLMTTEGLTSVGFFAVNSPFFTL